MQNEIQIPEPSPDPGVPENTRGKTRSPLFFNPWFQIFLSILGNAAAQLFMKKGADESLQGVTSFALVSSSLHSAWVWAGIACLIASLISWLYALRYVQLIIAFNLASLLNVLVPLLSWALLGDTISATRWAGIALVFTGVLVVAKPVIRMEEL